MEKNYFILLKIFFLLFSLISVAQTPGLIYKPSNSTLGKSVLDPNSDGFVSATTAGFSGTDYGAASELNMVSIPNIIAEPSGDLSTGGTGGHTEIVSFNGGNSVFILKKNTNGTDYLIIRFRIGNASTAKKGYSLLIDTDGQIGNTTSNNPGFEKEIILETGTAVKIYTHNVASGTITSTKTYNVEEYHQRSIALSTNNGDSDYFYDFFVPYNEIGLTGNVRFAATTITSANSGIIGTASDINGINDQQYGGNLFTIFNTIINSFPPTDLSTITVGTSFASLVSVAPVITSLLNTSSNTISGTSLEANGTSIMVYKNGTSFGSTTVSNSSWTLTGVSGLLIGDLITAKATATGKSISVVSNTMEVTKVQTCYIPAPIAITRTNGSQVVSGTWSNGQAIAPNTIRIRLYSLNANSGPTSATELGSGVPYYVNTDGTWSFTTNVSQATFNGLTVYAKAESATCISNLSNGLGKTSGGTTILTPAPSILTSTPIVASTGSQIVSVKNNHSLTATILLYVNSTIVGTNTGIATGATTTFSVTGLIEGDVVSAKAIDVTTANYYLSNFSNLVTVIGSVVQSNTPLITGSYISGSTSVSGTSTENAGTTIYLYINSTQVGTSTVNSYGNWTISGITLASGDIITAKADAVGKTISNSSNSNTVAASAPTPPIVTGPLLAGATSVSGTGGVGTIIVFANGTEIGSVNTTGNWTVLGIAGEEIFKGAIITAKNSQNGVLSSISNSITVTGVNSFKVTDTSNNPIGTQTAGTSFPIKISAMDGLNGTGNLVTTYVGNVVSSSTSTMIAGNGITSNFTAGILNSHTLNLTTAGNHTITVVSTTDPTAFGSSLVNIVAGPASKFNLTVSSNSSTGAQVITATAQLTDAYNNPVTTSGLIVTWTSTNGGIFNTTTTTTDSNGIATVNFTTANSTTTHILTATSGSYTGTSEVINVTTTLGVDELINALFKVYPNPVVDNQFYITIDLNVNSKSLTVELFNLLGKKVFEAEHVSNTNNKLITLPSNLSKGFYFVRLTSEKLSTTKKILLN